jgi:hypothetical protein
MFSRDQFKRAASLTEEDFAQLGKCRRPHKRLGFACQVAFVLSQCDPVALIEDPGDFRRLPVDDARLDHVQAAARLQVFICSHSSRR